MSTRPLLEHTAVKRAGTSPSIARRVPRRGRRPGPDATGFSRARAARDEGDQARLAAAIARHGYELLTPVGDGGMGRVWLARAKGAGVVAIKAMLPKHADDPSFRAMFLDEGRIASRIASPHVAKVFALHEDDGVLFQVMEWIDGESLLDLHKAAAKRREAIPVPVVLRALADACDGLHAAHELCDDEGKPLHVIHRDVSPANVLVSASGDVKLLDFGIAKARARLAESTIGFALKGRVHYVAPEYALGHPLDRRADTWSMGATLYFLLSGRAPFQASNETASLFKLTSGEPLPPLPSSIPREVAAIAYHALERDPKARFATAAEMRDALAAAARRIDGGEPRALLARFVADNESAEARERRRVAAEACDPEPVTVPMDRDALLAAVRDRVAVVRAAPERTVIAMALLVALLVVIAGVVATRDGPAMAAPSIVERAEPAPKAIDATGVDVYLEIYPTPAPRPIHAAAPPTHAAEPPAPPVSPASPAKRHYGF